MDTPFLYAPEPVVALHCSGAGAGQWRQLGETLGSRHPLIAPEHYGCQSTGPWTGEHAFTLADEATRTIEIIDRSDGNVHLVGHSYGGGVALRVAVERPERIASLTLYEPSAFHLLRALGERGASPLSEILGVAARTAKGVTSGNYRGAAASFVDYWSGRGAWAALRPSVQAALTRWMPKAPLDFRALINEPTPASVYARFPFSVLVMRGEHAPAPTRVIADTLSRPPSRREAHVNRRRHALRSRREMLRARSRPHPRRCRSRTDRRRVVARAPAVHGRARHRRR